jgi:hypothetical protein
MESNLDIYKDNINYKKIFIPSNNLHIVNEKDKLIEKVSLNTKINYPKYDKLLIDIIINIIINILEKEKYVISIDKLNNKVIENIPDKYASFYYLNKTIYDSIILNIYGNLFKAHGFIDDCKVFLEKFNYFKDKNILKEIHILVNYYNLFLHAKNLFTSTSLEYTTNMVSYILENNSFYKYCLILCKYVYNINYFKQDNNKYYSSLSQATSSSSFTSGSLRKNKILKSVKKVKKSRIILSNVVPDSIFDESAGHRKACLYTGPLDLPKERVIPIMFQRLPVGLGYLYPSGLPISSIPDAEPLDLLQADGACERLYDEETNSSNISNDIKFQDDLSGWRSTKLTKGFRKDIEEDDSNYDFDIFGINYDN